MYGYSVRQCVLKLTPLWSAEALINILTDGMKQHSQLASSGALALSEESLL